MYRPCVGDYRTNPNFISNLYLPAYLLFIKVLSIIRHSLSMRHNLVLHFNQNAHFHNFKILKFVDKVSPLKLELSYF